MGWQFWAAALLIIIWFLSKKNKGKAKGMSQDILYEVKNGKAVVIDVRESDEVNSGMAEPAIWLPKSDIDANGPQWKKFLGDLDKEKTIYVYCKAGGRAGAVCQRLSAEGLKAHNLGGFSKWQSAGLPTKPSP